MIRRDALAPDGGPLWLLIEQVAHARLAGELARHWRWPPPGVAGREQFLAAVFHHDDGWAAWDSLPGVDPRRRRPLAFTEMPLAVSTELWTRSITVAREIGPLATYMVAGHFHALLDRHDSWRHGPADARRAAEHFLSFALQHMAAARAQWAAAPDGEFSPAGDRLDADASLHALQAFDALSLWLCCTPRPETGVFSLPAAGAAGSVAVSRECVFTRLAENRVAVDPWPLAVARLPLATTALAVPATPIATDVLIPPKSARPWPLHWLLEPRG